MPLGVKSKGYRKYDTSTKPICHNCDYNDPFCTKTGLMASPDYAFKDDLQQRRAHKKN